MAGVIAAYSSDSRERPALLKGSIMYGCKGGQGRPDTGIVDNAVAIFVLALGFVAAIVTAGS